MTEKHKMIEKHKKQHIVTLEPFHTPTWQKNSFFGVEKIRVEKFENTDTDPKSTFCCAYFFFN